MLPMDNTAGSTSSLSTNKEVLDKISEYSEKFQKLRPLYNDISLLFRDCSTENPSNLRFEEILAKAKNYVNVRKPVLELRKSLLSVVSFDIDRMLGSLPDCAIGEEGIKRKISFFLNMVDTIQQIEVKVVELESSYFSEVRNLTNMTQDELKEMVEVGCKINNYRILLHYRYQNLRNFNFTVFPPSQNHSFLINNAQNTLMTAIENENEMQVRSLNNPGIGPVRLPSGAIIHYPPTDPRFYNHNHNYNHNNPNMIPPRLVQVPIPPEAMRSVPVPIERKISDAVSGLTSLHELKTTPEKKKTVVLHPTIQKEQTKQQNVRRRRCIHDRYPHSCNACLGKCYCSANTTLRTCRNCNPCC